MLTPHAEALALVCRSLDLLEDLRRARWLLSLVTETDHLDQDPEARDKIAYLLDCYLARSVEIESELTSELEEARQCLTLRKS